MPWPRPTLLQLRTQASQDITASNLPGADGFLRRAWLPVLGWVQAGMAYLMYGFLDWISRMSVPFTAEDEFLAAWAGLKGVTRKQSQFAGGNGVQFVNSVNGTPVPIGTILVRSDGVFFVSTAAVSVSGQTVTVPVVAQVGGSAGNCTAGTTFQFAVSIGGINGDGISTVDFTSGTDIEDDTPFRARMLLVYSAPPQGGAATDYEEWAEQLPQVTRVWVNPIQNGPGTVVVYFMEDVAESAFGGFPQGTNGVATQEPRDVTATGDQLVLANYLFPLRPVTAVVYCYAPTNAPQNITIAGLVPNTGPMQTAINASISSMFVLKGSPLGNGVTMSYDQSDVEGAILATPGVESFRVTSPAFPVALPLGSLPTLGVVTYV